MSLPQALSLSESLLDSESGQTVYPEEVSEAFGEWVKLLLVLLQVLDDVEDGFDLDGDWLRQTALVLLLHPLEELAENELGQPSHEALILLIFQAFDKDDLKLLSLLDSIDDSLQHQVKE